MYAPRRSAGASRAAIPCDVGTQSISPMTKTVMTKANVGIDPFSDRSRNGKPISSIAAASFGAAGMCSTRRVSRSWKIVTRAGLMITRKPHVDGERPCESTAVIGNTVSYET